MKKKRAIAIAAAVIAIVALVAILTGFIMMVGGCAREEPEPRAVRERICFICRTADNQIRNGYDLIFYSDDGSTETATLSGDSGNLSLDGTLTTAGAQTVNNDLTITGTLYSNVEILTIGDSVIITGTLMGNAEELTIGDSVILTGTLYSNVEELTIGDSVIITGTLMDDGETLTIGDSVDITGTATVNALDVDSGSITLQNDETIGNATDGLISLGGGVIYNSEWITPTSVTDGHRYTPTTTSLYVIDSTGAVSMTLGACSSTGQVLWTYGDDNNNVTINDTNVRTNDGSAQVLGQYDLIKWICIGTEWIEESESDNS